MSASIKTGIVLICVSAAVLTWEIFNRDASLEGRGNGLVFKVDFEGRNHFLAASFHLLKESDYPLPKPYEVGYQACEEIIFELGDREGGGRTDIAEKFFLAGKYQAASNLRNELSDADYRRLTTAMNAVGLKASALDQYRPWLAALTLATAKHISLGVLPEYGMESYFESRAKTDGKRISGLESVEAQISLFSELNESESAALLNQTVNEMSVSEERVFGLTRAWRAGDAESINRFLDEGRANNPEFYERMIDSRNHQWVEALIERMSESDCLMILVGAGHLFGDDGLVRLLERRGARITQVTAQ